MLWLLTCFLLSQQTVLVRSTKPAPIMFVVQAQSGVFHEKLAYKTKSSILNQWTKYVPSHVMEPPRVLLTTELEESLAYSAWTLFPLVGVLKQNLESVEDIEWVAILNENTDIDLRKLNEAVEKYKFKPTEQALFLGRGLKDSSSTIIHHFDSFESSGVMFPDLESGIFLSRNLVLSLWVELESSSSGFPDGFPKDFNIDPAYEFAKFLYKDGAEGGVSLTHLEEICAKKTSSTPNCITSFRQHSGCLKTSETLELQTLLSPEVTSMAVKTCSKFHDTRVPVVKETWGRHVQADFFSDEEDKDIPTIHLPYTVNTESGHCNKTVAILQHFLEMESSPEFLVIVDDDTILSASRLASLLACYRGVTSPILLGQRYGYMVATGRGGYNYITGGGGMVLNKLGVEAMLGLPGGCSCPSPDTPDDMHLGMCARRAKVHLLHSGRMFQARPPDYPSSLLAYRRPVSFHKHWEIDPHKVYTDYFEKIDRKLINVKDEL